VLAEHEDVDAVWYVGTATGRRAVEAASIGNMKRTWTQLDSESTLLEVAADEVLRESTQVKNIWIPFGA
jgi:aldehyde dehydrogenase (NAD+)